MGLFGSHARVGSSAAGDYEIEKSLRFNNADDAYLSRTFGTNSSDTTKTFSLWVKRGARFSDYTTLCATTQDGNIESRLQFSNKGAIKYTDRDSSSGTTDANFYTEPFYTDPSSWYHIVLIIDTTNGTPADRARIYVNGSRVTALTSVTNPASSYAVSFMRSSAVNYIGVGAASGSDDFSGYLAEVHFLDGTIKDPSNFGKTDADTGQWIPKKYGGGGYGNNGFYLNFSDNSGATATTLGKDSSGQGNNWTPNNFSVAAGIGNDSLEDTPTNNFCTLNPLVKPYGTNTFSQGNLHVDPSNDWNLVEGTFVVQSGKWYWEQQGGGSVGPSSRVLFGICSHGSFRQNAQNPQTYSGTIGYYDETGQKRVNNSYSSYGASYNVTGDVIGTALDMDARTVTFYKNGTSQGAIDLDDANDDFLEVTPACFIINATEATFNFGQRPFAHSAPANHKTLCTANLPEPTIKKPSDYFNTVLYTGNGAVKTVTGAGFQPNLLINKRRDAANVNLVVDSEIGTAYGRSTAMTDEDWTSNITLNSDGFVTANGSWGAINHSGGTYVSYFWKESATAGFDIVTYTGTGSNPQTRAHSLGVPPEMIILKNRSGTNDDEHWAIYHHKSNATPEDYWARLNTTGAFENLEMWNDTKPTSSVFTTQNHAISNYNGDTFVAYLFASVEGYSKVGCYFGTGDQNGPVVYTGFRPAWVLVKNAENASSVWNLHDSARDPYNIVNKVLYMNTDDDEEAYNIDNAASTNKKFFANGFQIYSTHDPELNASGERYIYLAFAETPFKYANAR